MTISILIRRIIAFTMMVCLLSLPIATLAASGKKGEKEFKNGMNFEASEQWDKAAEEFALAIVANPRNAEYRLHYQRALFNASQMFMKRGQSAVDEKDYVGAFNAFRKAYGYDPVNELAKAEMDRMLRLQSEQENGTGEDKDKKDDKPDVKLVPTAYRADGQTQQKQDDLPSMENLRTVKYREQDLQRVIKDLAKEVGVSVLFDKESFRQGQNQKITIELEQPVTAAKALDYIFLQESLFFQKVGPRTILVASNQRRQQYQQLVLRTFYLSNADPQDVSRVIQTAIPAQPGRTPTQVLTDKSTNSLTVRDTEENIILIAKLISSLDKDRAEVVMDVNIYEVQKGDMLSFGNQIGTAGENSTLLDLGGTTRGVVGLGGNELFGTLGRAASAVIPGAFGIGLVLPAANLQALQSNRNSKLLASTQVHAFNGEESQARIGQRVPVTTAQVPIGNGTGANNNFPISVVQYEQTGLTLKFTPLVFPNKDVQVKMNIESKEVVEAATRGDNPRFTERSISGTARIQNNRTLLLASVAQNNQSDGRTGLPLLGLIPILGRLFTAPSKTNSQSDIVIAVTPRVLRAPTILPEDEITRPTGSLITPTTGSLEAMVRQEEREEQLAAARRIPQTVATQLPDQPLETPNYVPSIGAANNLAKVSPTVAASVEPKSKDDVLKGEEIKADDGYSTSEPAVKTRPIDTSVKTLSIEATSDTLDVAPTLKSPEVVSEPKLKQTSLKESTPKIEPKIEEPKIVEPKIVVTPKAEFQLLSALQPMKAGEKRRIPVLVKSVTPFSLAVLSFALNPKQVFISRVVYGDAFGEAMAMNLAPPFVNQNGKFAVHLSMPNGNVGQSTSIIAYLDIEAIVDGVPDIKFDGDLMNLLSADGTNFELKLLQ